MSWRAKSLRAAARRACAVMLSWAESVALHVVLAGAGYLIFYASSALLNTTLEFFGPFAGEPQRAL